MESPSNVTAVVAAAGVGLVCCAVAASSSSDSAPRDSHKPSALPTAKPEPEPAQAAADTSARFYGKPEWAPFFARALASYEDCSLAKRPPSWADAAGPAAGDADDGCVKPLWLALQHAGGRAHTRASLDTFEMLDDKLVLAKALAAANLSEVAPPQLCFEHDAQFDEIVQQIESSPPRSLSPPDEAPVWVLKWAQGFGGQDIFFVRSPADAATIITNAHE